ncbi:Hint domain-containing protein [Litoreibacter ponti]|uniref:Hint domain-containing protein n=1 Tax=Litoreibacter ponti TaxID=1510457 RepID=A0A2T6BEH6_9RHOB|nr:Hint domain-containing protein [Litoreibacter ponti]PTX54451.1 Hint domain-containing protein [Litoreibacter ponti]
MFFKSSKKTSKSTPLVLETAPSAGIFAGTRLATDYAWTPVEELQVGDTVLTAEHGAQEIVSIEHRSLSVSAARANAKQWPLLVPEGAIGNTRAMLVSPDMRLVIEDEAAATLFGEPCVSLRAENLIGYRGIARARISGDLSHVTLRLAGEETLVVEGGVYIDLPSPTGTHRFTPLSDRQARQLSRLMGEADRKNRARPVVSAWI